MCLTDENYDKAWMSAKVHLKVLLAQEATAPYQGEFWLYYDINQETAQQFKSNFTQSCTLACA